MKKALPQKSQLWKDDFQQKKIIWNVRDGVNLGNTLIYLKIQEKLRLENLKGHYLCKGLFLCFSLPRKYKRKIKQIIELA